MIWGTEDQYAPVGGAHRVAKRVGGEIVVLDGGHWVAFERPDEAAQALESFWAAHP